MVLEKFSLAGQVGIVTGGGQGLGKVFCHAFAEAGADVVVAEINPETGPETVAEIEALGRRAIFVQTPGCFETANAWIGMDTQLMEMALRPQMMRALYRKQVGWTQRYVDNCLELGADVIHASDDLGQNGRMLFSPQTFRDVVKPVMGELAAYVRERSPYLSLHSCGYFAEIIEDVIEDMKYDARHSYEDAICPVEEVYEQYRDRIAILGGIDVDFVCRSTPEEVF